VDAKHLAPPVLSVGLRGDAEARPQVSDFAEDQDAPGGPPCTITRRLRPPADVYSRQRCGLVPKPRCSRPRRKFLLTKVTRKPKVHDVERHSRCGGEADRFVMLGPGRVAQGFEEGLMRGR